MSDNQVQSCAAYENFEAKLSAFISRVTKQCDNMESALGSYRSVLTDDQCDPLLNRGKKATQDIKECIAPAQRTLEMVREIVEVLKQGPSMSR